MCSVIKVCVFYQFVLRFYTAAVFQMITVVVELFASLTPGIVLMKAAAVSGLGLVSLAKLSQVAVQKTDPYHILAMFPPEVPETFSPRNYFSWSKD